MDSNLHIEIPLKVDYVNDSESLQKAVTTAIMHNENIFDHALRKRNSVVRCQLFWICAVTQKLHVSWTGNMIFRDGNVFLRALQLQKEEKCPVLL